MFIMWKVSFSKLLITLCTLLFDEVGLSLPLPYVGDENVINESSAAQCHTHVWRAQRAQLLAIEYIEV